MADISFVDSNNTIHRPDGTYGNVINQIKKDGVCPFCSEYLAAYHKNPIDAMGECWLVTDNAYPYEGAAHHLLFIHKKHIENFSELSSDAWLELQGLISQSLATKSIKGAALLFRFGDTNYTGASVRHLHAMVVSGKGEAGAAPVLARVG